MALSVELKNFEKKFSQEKSIPDYLNISSNYFTHTAGAYRLFQAIKKALSWPILYAKELKISTKTITKLTKVRSKTGVGERLLLIPKMISDVKCISDYSKDYEKSDVKKRDKLAKKIVETVSDCSLFIQLGEIFGIYTLGTIIGPSAIFSGSLFLLLQNIIGLKIEREDYIFHRNLQENNKECVKSNERLITLLSEHKNLDLIKIVKSVISIALSVFILIEFVFSMSFLSPTALLLLSTSTTLLAIWTNYYQQSMTYTYEGK